MSEDVRIALENRALVVSHFTGGDGLTIVLELDAPSYNNTTPIYLDAAQARQLRDALTTYLGEEK